MLRIWAASTMVLSFSMLEKKLFLRVIGYMVYEIHGFKFSVETDFTKLKRHNYKQKTEYWGDVVYNPPEVLEYRKFFLFYLAKSVLWTS